MHSFAQRMPFTEPPDSVADWEYLYERSAGCVGVLKDWLVRGSAHALKRGTTRLTRSDLEPYALSVSQCERMLSEAIEGELRLRETSDERCRLRTRLGLANCTPGEGRLPADSSSKPHGRGRLGERRPVRDSVGRCTLLGGKHH